MPHDEVAYLVNYLATCKLSAEWQFGKEPYCRANPPPTSPLLRPASGSDAERRFIPDRTEHDLEDPDLGAAAMDDNTEFGGGQAGGEAGGSGHGVSFDDWPDDD
ncbi:hypothetical protein PSTG_19191 [Puccinia striiformis f. sp. tritici PST-78]|uniref:Uncharacterized protein n=1 Tax=Puccinia striiformis f. sp. tritici PST-78 TaxID=1165861 RepID=A0A0L0UKZ8_9BASI|nr:hypothetical protein PSTG_19191 [Puccinia striiformis f. sp. tritici PST-78]